MTMAVSPQCGAFLLALVAFVALSSVPFEHRGGHDAAPRTQSKEDPRALRLARYPGRPFNTTLTVVLARTFGSPSFTHSPFQTHLLGSYGSGRLDFDARDGGICGLVRPPASAKRGGGRAKQPKQRVDVEAPCLVVASVRCPLPALKSKYPQCMTMSLSDERCSNSGYDFGQYYSDKFSGTAGYLPLGPRADSWESFRKIQANTGFFVKAASKRKFAFNAIFSQNTNDGRARLAKLIEKDRDRSDLPIFASMARRWTKYVNDPNTQQLHTDEYVATLLDSVFTLVPAGHNPESYRLYEAVEAGSIPFLTQDDLGGPGSPCGESLRAWADAPVIVLDSWSGLFPWVEKLLRDPARLDEMQVRLRAWYDEHMRRVVAGFEDRMIRSSLEEGGAVGPAAGNFTAHPILRTLNG